MLREVVTWLALLVGVLVIVTVYVTPWPSVLVIRAIFDCGAEQASAALAPKVPADVKIKAGLVYAAADADARVDIYRGASAAPSSPIIVWFHGGGFVSGRRSDVANYLNILAGRGVHRRQRGLHHCAGGGASDSDPAGHKALAYLGANAEWRQCRSACTAVQGHGEGVGRARGRVTELFYPTDYQPPLAHEYQFNLDTEAGRLALDRSVEWLGSATHGTRLRACTMGDPVRIPPS